jgi:hypothetical protein
MIKFTKREKKDSIKPKELKELAGSRTKVDIKNLLH